MSRLIILVATLALTACGGRVVEFDLAELHDMLDADGDAGAP